MRTDVSFKYVERSKIVDAVLDKNFKKIERRVKIFRRDAPIHISVHIEKNPHREQYFCSTHIYLPSKLIKVDEKGLKIETVINKSFAAVSKQLDKIKYKVERHLQKGRTGLKDEIEE